MSATRSSQIFHRCQEPERPIERDLTCGISPIGLAVSDNEVEIEYGSAVFSSGLRTGYDDSSPPEAKSGIYSGMCGVTVVPISSGLYI